MAAGRRSRCCARRRSSSADRCHWPSPRRLRSAPTCSSAWHAKHEIAYLLTRPDRPRGRGRQVAPPPAKEAAERLGIEVRQPERLDEAFDPDVDTVVVAAYGLLIPEPVLAGRSG